MSKTRTMAGKQSTSATPAQIQFGPGAAREAGMARSTRAAGTPDTRSVVVATIRLEK
jgi:hypothetical protein